MLLHGVLAQIQPIGDFFVGKAQHEIDDHHLFALSEMILVLDVRVWISKSLMQLLDRDEYTAIASEWFIGDTKAAQ